MSVDLLYLVGAPGSGKSTLFAALTESWRAEGILATPAHMRYYSHDDPQSTETTLCAVQLGLVREKFSGTDALPMNIQPKAIKFLQAYYYPYGTVPVIAEGDRLGNASFFSEVKRLGINLSVVLLDCPQDELVRRRVRRGSDQNPVWLRGRETKVERLSESFVLPRWRLDATLPVSTLVEKLRQHPILSKK